SLDVPSVGQDLAFDLAEQHRASDGGPLLTARELWKRGADEVQRKRFTGEMRVRAEVIREVTLHVRQLPVDADQHVDEPRRTSAGRLRTPSNWQAEQRVEGPRPRDRSKS